MYVLVLEHGKYYLGITTKTPEERMREHRNGYMGARWTRKYRPLKIIDRKDLGVMTYKEAELFESRATRKYMKAKGMNNVRGGDLTSIDDYVLRFGNFFEKEDWIMFRYALLLMSCFAIFIVLHFLGF